MSHLTQSVLGVRGIIWVKDLFKKELNVKMMVTDEMDRCVIVVSVYKKIISANFSNIKV